MSTPDPVAIPRDQLLPTAAIAELLTNDAVAVRVQEKGLFPKAGELVGVRLNLNVMRTTGKAIQTLHRPTNSRGYKKNQGFYNGEACGYAQAVVLRNAFFNVSQGGREKIASGQQHKFAMASVDGELVTTTVAPDFEGIEVRFNPKAHHLFVDANDQAIHSAEEVLVLGSRAYARGKIVYHTELTAPRRAGDYPSQTKIEPAGMGLQLQAKRAEEDAACQVPARPALR